MTDDTSDTTIRTDPAENTGTLLSGHGVPRATLTQLSPAGDTLRRAPDARHDHEASLDSGLPPRLPGERFEDRGEIGRGGMGKVHSVFDRVMRRGLAMKVLSAGAGSRPTFAERFCEEARLTGQLNHPNIVPVHDMGTRDADGGVFFTMDRVEGETFTSVIESLHAGPLVGLELERILGVFLKVCDAVEFAHSRGVVHRDIKPENIMVGPHGRVYLLDWGVALERARPGGNGVAGTAAYMPPEQAWGNVSETDERSDIYGLGGILYEILTGRAPHLTADPRETMARARSGLVRPPHEFAIWPELPPGLCQITQRALAAAPGDRYQTVAELRMDVQQFLRGGGWFSTQVCEPGVVIVREGDSAEAAYIIVEGRCEVLKAIGGESVSVRQLGPGEVFGETAVLTNQARTATVVAVERTMLKVVTRESLEAELQRNPWLGAFVRALAERFREVDRELTRSRAPDAG